MIFLTFLTTVLLSILCLPPLWIGALALLYFHRRSK